MNTKGQITSFIILGIVILIAVGFTVYFLQYQPTPPTVQVDENILPVYNNVFLCVKELSTQGVNKLGLQGGYLNIPPAIKNNPSSRVSLTPSGSFSIPYWFYEGENRIPTIEQMQREISLYVKDNLKDCVDFTALPEFEVEELGEINVLVFFADKEVAVDVKWPLRIKTKQKSFDQDNFRVELPVNLKKVHELAERIMNAENKNELFENATIKLLSANPEIPMDGLDFSCTPKKWHLKDVKETFRQMLTYNLPHVRIKNTDYLDYSNDENEYYRLSKDNERMNKELNALTDYDTSNPLSAVRTPKSEAPDDAFDYNNLNFNVDTPSTMLRVGFNFNPQFDFMFNAHPNDGGLMSSNVIKGESKYLKFFCTNEYHFTYDIIYPVIAYVRDPSAFEGEGYVYQFAFPVLINNNHGDRKAFGLKKFVSPYFDAEYCDKKSQGMVEFTVRGFEQSMPISTELDNASVEFICGPKICPLGKTESRKGGYSLATSLPEGCGNPIIRAGKEGYLPEQKVLLQGNKKLDFDVTELRKLNIDVLKLDYDKYMKKLGSPERLSVREELLIYVSSPDHPDFNQYLVYPDDLTLDLISKDAAYNFEFYLKLKDIGTTLGGKKLENVKINYDEFGDKNTIVLKTPKMTPLPTNDQESAEMNDLIYNEEFIKELRPEFK